MQIKVSQSSFPYCFKYTGTSTQELSPQKPLLGKSKHSRPFAEAAQEWIIYESGAPLANSFVFHFFILRYGDGPGLKVQWGDYLTRATRARLPKRLLYRGSSVSDFNLTSSRNLDPNLTNGIFSYRRTAFCKMSTLNCLLEKMWKLKGPRTKLMDKDFSLIWLKIWETVSFLVSRWKVLIGIQSRNGQLVWYSG